MIREQELDSKEMSAELTEKESELNDQLKRLQNYELIQDQHDQRVIQFSQIITSKDKEI